MKETTINATDFWDHYFRDQFIHLERHADKYIGVISRESGNPFAFLVNTSKLDVAISTSTLRSYDYVSDPRFTLITKIPIDIVDAYSAVENQTYPYRDPAPFGPERLAELFNELRDAYWPDSKTKITLPAINSILADLVSSYVPSIVQQIAALAWFVGERRDVSSADALLSIITDSNYVGGTMHFTAVNAAFDALWKVNPKLQLPTLVQLMHQANETGKRSIGALLSRLLSTNVMLSPEKLGENYYQPHYWSAVIKQTNAGTQIDWNQYDANALYWEIRYLAARRLLAEDLVNSNKLADDIVSIVASTVRRKL